MKLTYLMKIVQLINLCVTFFCGLHALVNRYENLPMQYTEIFSAVKIENFVGFFKIFFLFLLKT